MAAVVFSADSPTTIVPAPAAPMQANPTPARRPPASARPTRTAPASMLTPSATNDAFIRTCAGEQTDLPL